jgi:phosphoglycerol transferase MdoB-like AlkP superfamily enzyme
MNKVVFGFIILCGLLLALYFGVGGLIGLVAWLFIIVSAFSLLLRGKFPSHFISLLFWLLIGPVLICCLIRALFSHSGGILGLVFSSVPATLILLILMTISFLYVRARLTHLKSNEGKQLHTNERRPVLPAPNEHDGEV